MSDRIGFLQGRLSPLIEGRIQAFPWSCWRAEFPMGERNGFHLMEWTLDQHRLRENPLLDPAGQADIAALSRQHGLMIHSLTADCFMQAPFWKAQESQRGALERDFLAVVQACAAGGLARVVVPLVDNGRLESAEQQDTLVTFLQQQSDLLAEEGVQVLFESDFGPSELARFIGRLDPALFGINYDIGNSAALGFSPAEEIAAYGRRILGVHVKDRALGGPTVPLGSGAADFEAVFGGLQRVGYTGHYILQTARAADDDHAGVLCRYRDMTLEWLDRHEA
ncbi:MAG: TIM barrel protein [Chloroflexi bacterium]|nr:TIM barrel protein [Chloroflexota bacterium]